MGQEPMKIFFQFAFMTCLGLGHSAYGQSSHVAKMNEIKDQYELPGMGLGLVELNKTTQVHVVGVREAGKPSTIKPIDRFHLGSQTKAMTAYLILNLVKEKKISFDSTMREIFPEFNLHPELKDVSVRMLLVHRSGLERGIPEYEYIREKLNRAKTIVEARSIISRHLLENSPKIKPNTVDSYSNAGYLILGHILEKFYNKSFEEHITSNLFIPIRMKSCGFGKSPEVSGHYVNKGVLTVLNDDNLSFWGPAGTVHCNLQDWGEFIKAQLIRMKTEKEFYQVDATSQMDYTLSAMFRLKRDWSKEDVFSHSGTNLLNYARLWIDPNKNRAFLVVTNRGGDESFSGSDEVLNETAKATNDLVTYIIKESQQR
jgi:CubicO group peptidase (beta-lactamase class C family)